MAMTGEQERGARSTARDRVLKRLTRARRGMYVAAAAVSAGVGAFVSSAAPGRTLAGIKHPRLLRPAGSTPALKMPPLASPSDLGLQSPGVAPTPIPTPQVPGPSPAPVSPQPQAVVSGGS
jgi:hypothetical protein